MHWNACEETGTVTLAEAEAQASPDAQVQGPEELGSEALD